MEKKLWILEIKEKFKMLLWSIANWQIIPTRSVIGKSNNIDEKECMLCEAEEATLEYIIMHCFV